MVHKIKEKEKFFDVRIVGKSTMLDENEVVDLLYEALKNKAEFKIR